jgi:RHH-type proline utilization regulon transcriptional repressor/proline dehydrogenase/delta 1-pyrroline-5-carboxylate dehydrogenase
LKPRGRIAALAQTESGMLIQIGAILATGNVAVVEGGNPAAAILKRLPRALAARLVAVANWHAAGVLAGVLFAGDSDGLLATNRAAAALDGPIMLVQGVTSSGLASGEEDYALDLLLEEVSISTNTAAAGGNASLMTIG